MPIRAMLPAANFPSSIQTQRMTTMIQVIDRREFIKQAAQASLTMGVAAGLTAMTTDKLRAAPKQLFQISLAQWSLHQALFAKQLDNLDFAKTAKQDYGISAIEYVNQFFKDKAKDTAYLKEMLKRTKDLGVENRLI